ncbi:MAG: hypothetical protein PHU06_10780 [Gallionella sp.]|nr:hypothetical protein [Gallionella sp.]MDD4960167.1 hypothetical protein [Gallionella sp.]
MMEMILLVTGAAIVFPLLLRRKWKLILDGVIAFIVGFAAYHLFGIFSPTPTSPRAWESFLVNQSMVAFLAAALSLIRLKFKRRA